MSFTYYPGNKHITIIDETYGLCYILRGQIGKDQPALCVADYGLHRDNKKLVRESLRTEKPIQSEIAGLPEGSHLSFYRSDTGSIAKILEEFKARGFTSDPLSRRYVGREVLPEKLSTIPVDGRGQITENVGTHFRNKVESVLHCSDIKADIFTFSTLPTNQKDTPFFLVRARLKEDYPNINEKKKHLRLWCQNLMPEAVILRADISEGQVDLGFYPTKKLNELIYENSPSFSTDPIDGHQAVQFQLEVPISEAQMSLMRARLVEVGAVVNCIREGSKDISMDVPCSYNLGGTVGRAFESRMYYILSYLEENIQSSPNYSLMERKSKDIQKDTKQNTGQLVNSLEESPAFVIRLCSLDEVDVPFLFSRAKHNEVFLLCEDSNSLIARREGTGKVSLFHGVPRNGKAIENIWSYYPNLINIGKGRQTCQTSS